MFIVCINALSSPDGISSIVYLNLVILAISLSTQSIGDRHLMKVFKGIPKIIISYFKKL